MSTGPLVVRTDNVYYIQENTKSRAASFQKMFDKRVWGNKFDAAKGLQASGKITTLVDNDITIGLALQRVQRYYLHFYCYCYYYHHHHHHYLHINM